jgi:hypothetical protein
LSPYRPALARIGCTDPAGLHRLVTDDRHDLRLHLALDRLEFEHVCRVADLLHHVGLQLREQAATWQVEIVDELLRLGYLEAREYWPTDLPEKVYAKLAERFCRPPTLEQLRQWLPTFEPADTIVVLIPL